MDDQNPPAPASVSPVRADQSEPAIFPPPLPPLYPRCTCEAPAVARTVSGVGLCPLDHVVAVLDPRAALRVLRPPPKGERYLNRRERRTRAARERRAG